MALKNNFPRLATVVANMTLGQRCAAAEALREHPQQHPLMLALAWELDHANTVEAGFFAEADVELSKARFAEADRQFAEAGIPQVPAAAGAPVFLDVDQPPAA